MLTANQCYMSSVNRGIHFVFPNRLSSEYQGHRCCYAFPGVIIILKKFHWTHYQVIKQFNVSLKITSQSFNRVDPDLINSLSLGVGSLSLSCPII